jgi:hypothetical protein
MVKILNGFISMSCIMQDLNGFISQFHTTWQGHFAFTAVTLDILPQILLMIKERTSKEHSLTQGH